MTNPPATEEAVERVRDAIWREDHYDPKLCGHGGEAGSPTCPYCEPHDDDKPVEWPADLERAERQARAAIAALTKSPPVVSEGMVGGFKQYWRNYYQQHTEFPGTCPVPVIRGDPNDHSPDPRICIHQFKPQQNEPDRITIGLYMGNSTWVEQRFTPEAALAMCGLILSKPAVEALAMSVRSEATQGGV